jgi:tetratricopeptide (TPR) repeat protein
MLYEKGLEQAKNKHLTSAIETLTRSVDYNKNNVEARNLLGLCYFQIGLFADALKHWIISVAAKHDKNPANDYLQSFQLDSRLMERYSDSLAMYNAALTQVRQRNDDLATIQLKKVIEYNPNFTEAMNLLSLCYIVSKQESKAVSLVTRVLDIDASSPAALRYSKIVLHTKDFLKQSAPQPAPKQLARPAEILSKRSSAPFFSASAVLSLVIGAAIAALLFIFVFNPPQIEEKNQTIAEYESNIQSEKEKHKEELKQKESEIQAANTEAEEWKQKYEESTAETELAGRITQAELASVYYSAGRLTDALSVIDSTDTTGFSNELIEELNTIKTQVYKQLGVSEYNAGRSHYNSGRYTEAVQAFEAALRYVLPDSDYTGDAYYYLGRIAEMNGDAQAASSYYKLTVDNYPNALNYNSAVNRYNRLQ